ncbi:HEAT repeat domain-containing protein [Paludisphaera mucosa]|uniref:HEAT repeat domain-containing protein n=1 Tax=Paludisphaera mucosa TaxID=3030827 RepID=A0ABT6F3N6_9BACT|nr:HEAT repeat domain-containing protein [Paludisphaera mucosa]MDG3002190.1 HEAT repeat domain-containing protein [Paludisphaera mucosa]
MDTWSSSDSSRTPLTRRQRLAVLAIAAAACLPLVFWAATHDVFTRRRGDPAVDAHIQALGEEDAYVRREAAARLGDAGPDDSWKALAALAGAADDVQPQVREAAARSIAWLVTKTAGDAGGSSGPFGEQGGAGAAFLEPARAAAAGVLKCLTDPDPAVRTAAADALAAFGKPPGSRAPRELISALDDPFPAVRYAAARALSEFSAGLDPAIPPLLRLIAADDQWENHYRGPLRKLKPSPAVVPDLIAALKGPDARGRIASSMILGNIGPEASEAIPELLSAFEGSLESADAPASFAMPDLTFDASLALARIAPGAAARDQVVAALSAALRSEKPRVRDASAYALGSMGGEAAGAIPELLAALERGLAGDGTADAPAMEELAREACRALSRIAPGAPSGDRVVAALTAALRSKRPPVRAAAAEALGLMGGEAEGAILALASALGEAIATPGSFDCGTPIASALGRIAPGCEAAPAAVAALVPALRADRVYTREAAARSLGRFGPLAAGSIPELRRTPRDSYGRVQIAVEEALREIDPHAAAKSQ